LTPLIATFPEYGTGTKAWVTKVKRKKNGANTVNTFIMDIIVE